MNSAAYFIMETQQVRVIANSVAVYETQLKKSRSQIKHAIFHLEYTAVVEADIDIFKMSFRPSGVP